MQELFFHKPWSFRVCKLSQIATELTISPFLLFLLYHIPFFLSTIAKNICKEAAVKHFCSTAAFYTAFANPWALQPPLVALQTMYCLQ